jgi:ankyrin repeat protein
VRHYFTLCEFSRPSLSLKLFGKAALQGPKAVTEGADVNSRDDHGNTLLMQAAVYSTPALMEFLLANGANQRRPTSAGYTALMRAMPDLVKIKMLVEHGADVNAASEEGMTPIIIAASISYCGPRRFAYLIQKGANLQAIAQRQGGGDAVMLAATQGAFANLKILLDAGANGRTLRRAPACASSRRRD